MKPFQQQTHYELLEVSVAATAGEIRGAGDRLSRLYSDDQLVLYGLIEPARAEALRRKLLEAVAVLTDDAQRDAYDQSIGLPPREGAKKTPPAPVRQPEAAAASTGWSSFSYSWVSAGPATPVAARAPSSYTVPAPAPGQSGLESSDEAPVRPERSRRAPGANSGGSPSPSANGSAQRAESPIALGAAGARSAPLDSARGERAPQEQPRDGFPSEGTWADLHPIALAVPSSIVASPVVEAPVSAPTPIATGGPGIEKPVAEAEPAPAVKPPEAAAIAEAPRRAESVPPVASTPPEVTVAATPSAPTAHRGANPVQGLAVALVEAAAPLPLSPRGSAPVHSLRPASGAEPLSADEPVAPRFGEDGLELALVPPRPAPVLREYRVPEPRPKPFEVPAGVEFNGDLLRQVRMARGMSLLQLAERTRIGVRHLENVEADRYDALPVAVYLRGILMNLARELGLDGMAVAKSYLAFVEAHQSKG